MANILSCGLQRLPESGDSCFISFSLGNAGDVKQVFP